jgi:hypothetical protein
MGVEAQLLSLFNLVVVSQLHAPAALPPVKTGGTLHGLHGWS